jgi:hypothetical protein
VYSSRSGNGVDTLPLLFDIFLRSGSVTKPDTAMWRHGTEFSCSSAFAIV